MRRPLYLYPAAAAVVAGLAINPTAHARDKVSVAASFVGLWDTTQPTMCKQRGEFGKAGLDVEIVSTRGGSETVQAVIAGGMDIGYSPGTNAVIAAYMQGAPIRIITSEFVGQNDTFMYVPVNSPIKTIADIAGKKVAFPRPGGASEAMLLAFREERKIDFNLVATGGLSATHTMVMTGQVDVGYSFPPWGLGAVVKNEVRILFAGDEVKSLRDITGRVNIGNVKFVKSRRAVAEKFFAVLDRCIDWAYANQEAAAKMLAPVAKVSEEAAKRTVAFYRREALAFAPILGFDRSIEQALKYKFIDKAPTAAQAKEMIDLVVAPK